MIQFENRTREEEQNQDLQIHINICENWLLNRSSESSIMVWERNVLRTIYAGKTDNGNWNGIDGVIINKQ